MIRKPPRIATNDFNDASLRLQNVVNDRAAEEVSESCQANTHLHTHTLSIVKHIYTYKQAHTHRHTHLSKLSFSQFLLENQTVSGQFRQGGAVCCSGAGGGQGWHCIRVVTTDKTNHS